MKLNLNLENTEVKKYNYIYNLFLRVGILCMFLFLTFLPILAIAIEGYKGKEDLWVLIFIPVDAFLAFATYYLWNAKITINEYEIRKKGLREKTISWSDIDEVLGYYSHQGHTILKLKTNLGKKIELAGPVSVFKDTFENIAKELERSKDTYIHEMPEFTHSQFPTFLKRITSIFIFILYFAFLYISKNTTIIDNLPWYSILIFIPAISIGFFPILLILIGNIKCNGNYISFTRFKNKNRFKWSEIESIIRIQEHQMLFIPHYSMDFSTKDGLVTIRTMNRDTLDEFNKIRYQINNIDSTK